MMDFENFENYLFGYVQKLWNSRKLILITCLVSFLFSVVCRFGSPSVYTSSVSIVPEANLNTSDVSSMASFFGVGSNTQDVDAVNISMSPNIVKSTPFLLELFNDTVTTVDGKRMLLPEYVKSQRTSLLGFFFQIPGRIIGFVRSALNGFPNADVSSEINPFRLTKGQYTMLGKFKDSIISENMKGGITKISVTFQDPLVAATVANIVTERLRDYVVAYKTEKASNNFAYISEMRDQAEKEYYEAQKEYAEYVDSHSSVILKSALIEQERLQNEVNLKFKVFSELASQVPVAKNKIQEAKPLYAILEPATVPVHADNMGLMKLSLLFIVLGLVVSSAWILFGRPFWNDMMEWRFQKDDCALD